MKILAAVLAAGLAISVHARPDDECCGHFHGLQDPARRIASFDSATGKDLRTFPPSRHADYEQMSLTIDIPDMNTPRMGVVQRLRLSPIGKPMASLSLDARLLKVKSVESAGPGEHRVMYSHDGQTLELKFEPPLPEGRTAELVTTYTVEDPPYGITWTPESPAWPGRPAQLHTQGQAEHNRYWFPCHDSPNERLTTELIVTVPSGFLVSSNGRLVRPSSVGEGGRTTFHWLQDKPHVNYLVTLVVGKFDVENVARSGKDRIPMPVYVPPGRGKDIKGTYGNTARMVDAFERRTGQAYPWDQYAQVVVWNFGAGGMENTSATTMYDTAIFTAEALKDGDLDGLISHELAHQWFGDLITCKSWEHIWLNEGFATYFTTLWWEERDGRDGYIGGVIGNFDRVIGVDKADAPFQAAMASKDYRDPWETFRKPANPYPKGASILHMLRVKLGDEVFFRGLAAYVQKFKYKEVETNDFRRVLEDVSGEALEQFFAQWCYRPGVPELEVANEWNSDNGELVVTVEQKQNINGANPAFAFDLPIWVEARAGAGPTRAGVVSVRDRKATAKFKVDQDPSMVAVDPDLSVLAKMTISQSMRRWLAQLERGPTLGARVQAARALAGDTSGIASATLAKVAGEARGATVLRKACITTLGERGDIGQLAKLARAQIKNREVREEMITVIGKVLGTDAQSAERGTLLDTLVSSANSEESERVRAAALRAIGTLKLKERLPILIAATDLESQHDRVRQAALEGLASMDAPEGLSVALRYSQAGILNRTRPIAIAAVGTLAKHNMEAAVPVLIKLLSDRERRAWQAAGEALVRTRDAKAVPALQALQKVKQDVGDRETIQKWIDAIATPTP